MLPMVRLLRPVWWVLLISPLLSIPGCGSGSGNTGSSQTLIPQPDFSVSIPASITVTPNSAQSISISVGGTNGFSNPVNLTLSGLPSGVSASPATFTLTPAASSSSGVDTRETGAASSSQTVQITGGSNTTAGQLSMTVTATSGSITHSAMTPTGGADFALTVPQPTLSVAAGSSSTLSISADAFNSFAGPVSVSLSGLPQGMTALPASFTVTPGTPQTVTLTAAQGTQSGNSTILLQGASGNLNHNLELSLAISSAPAPPPPDFSVSVTPATLILQAGGTAQPFTVSATALNGFTGTINVNLSGLPNGVAATPATLILSPGSSQQIALNAASTTAGGTSVATVAATSGAIAHSAQLSLTVQPATPDFSVSVTPATLLLQAGGTAQPFTVSATALNGFTGTINVNLSGLPNGVAATPATLILSPGSSQQIALNAASTTTGGTSVATVAATSGAIAHSAQLSLTVQPATPDFSVSVTPATLILQAGGTAQPFTVSATALNGFTGTINVNLSGLPNGVAATPATLILSPGSSQQIALNAASTTAGGTSVATVAATSGAIAHSTQLSLTVQPATPDFSVSVTPATLILQAGGTAQPFTVSATALNGFTGTINVNLSGLPNGVAATPATLILSPGSSQQIALNAASTTTGGTSVATVAATSGAIAHSAQLSLTVQPIAPDFSLSIDAANAAVSIGGAALQISVTANAVGAFTSPVNVSLAGLPAGVTATPSALTLTPGSAQTISLQEGSSAIAGETSVTFQGTSGGLSRSAALSLTVAPPSPDFQLFAGPSTLNLSPLVDQRLTIALIPLNGFNDAATVTVSGLPAGVTLLFPPLPLFADIPQALQLDASGATAGQSTITITATAGSITHTAQVNLNVSAATQDTEGYVLRPYLKGPIDPGLLLAPGTFCFDISLQSAGTPGAGVGTAVQLSGLLPGMSLDQSQYTFPADSSGNPEPASFTITTTASAVGESGVLKAVFTGGQVDHEVDLPIHIVSQPSIVAYIAPITIRQGSAASLFYEAASTSQNGVQLYLGPNWPQNFWLNPYPAEPNFKHVTYTGIRGSDTQSVSAAANAALGTINLPFQFSVDITSQTVSVPAQVVPFTDFGIAATPATIALNGGASQAFTVSASAVNDFSTPVSVSLDNLPSGLQASPQTFTLNPGSSQTVTLTTDQSYTAGGVLTVDATSGGFEHSTQVAVSPGSFTGDLAVTGNTFSGLGVAQIYTSGTYGQVTALGDPNANGILGYVPSQLKEGSVISTCGGNTSDPSCAVNIALVDSQALNAESADTNDSGTLVLSADFGGGQQYAILPFDQTLPDFSLNFTPATLTIPSGGTASLSIGYMATPTLFSGNVYPQYCGPPFYEGKYTVDNGNPNISYYFNLTAQVPPPLNSYVHFLASQPIDLCNPQSINPQSINVVASNGAPPGTYVIMMSSQLYELYEPNFVADAAINPGAIIGAAHTFALPVTITAAPPPSF